LQQATTGPADWTITEWTKIISNDIWLDPTSPAWCCLRRHHTQPGSRFRKPTHIRKCPNK